MAELPTIEVPGTLGLPERGLEVPAMGGRLLLRVAHDPGREAEADAALARTAQRVNLWASRLTRFTATSDLAALNADPSRPVTPVRPMLAAVLDWAERITDSTDGRLDITLLDQRLAAQHDPDAPVDDAPHPWWLERRPRGAIVRRAGTFRFDLDGVAKGWIADRALEQLRAFPAAIVDADGDIAMHLAPDLEWTIGIADPRDEGDEDLALLRFDDRLPGRRVAVATSGTSVHRWEDGGRPRHHLLDPRTRRPAETDIVQATVIASSAREAEVLAKSALIAGSDAGFDRLEQSAARGALLLVASGETIAIPRTLELLA